MVGRASFFSGDACKGSSVYTLFRSLPDRTFRIFRASKPVGLHSLLCSELLIDGFVALNCETFRRVQRRMERSTRRPFVRHYLALPCNFQSCSDRRCEQTCLSAWLCLLQGSMPLRQSAERRASTHLSVGGGLRSRWLVTTNPATGLLGLQSQRYRFLLLKQEPMGTRTMFWRKPEAGVAGKTRRLALLTQSTTNKINYDKQEG